MDMMTSTLWDKKRKGHVIKVGKRTEGMRFSGRPARFFASPGIVKAKGGLPAVCAALEKCDSSGLQLL